MNIAFHQNWKGRLVWKTIADLSSESCGICGELAALEPFAPSDFRLMFDKTSVADCGKFQLLTGHIAPGQKDAGQIFDCRTQLIKLLETHKIKTQLPNLKIGVELEGFVESRSGSSNETAQLALAALASLKSEGPETTVCLTDFSSEDSENQIELVGRYAAPVVAIDQILASLISAKLHLSQMGLSFNSLPTAETIPITNALQFNLSWDYENGLSREAFCERILHNIKALNAFTNVHPNSYARLTRRFPDYVPAYYGVGNRSALIRLTSDPLGSQRLELRFPDSAGNFYLAILACLCAVSETSAEGFAGQRLDRLPSRTNPWRSKHTYAMSLYEAAEAAYLKREVFCKNGVTDLQLQMYLKHLVQASYISRQKHL